MSRGLTRCGLIAAGLAIALVLPPDAGAWPAAVSGSIARDARRLLPRGLAMAMARRDDPIRAELGRLPEDLTRAVAVDILDGQLDAETVAAAQPTIDEVLGFFKKRKVGEGLVRMGGLARVPIDLSDPALASEESLPAAVRDEYYLFVQVNMSKFPVVLGDPGALELGRGDLAAYWQRLLNESRADTAVIRAEMLRGGRVLDHRAIDYRSPVFAVASLSYSRAVTAVAATWLAIWRSARGDLTMRPKPIEVIPGAPPTTRPGAPLATPTPLSEVKQ